MTKNVRTVVWTDERKIRELEKLKALMPGIYAKLRTVVVGEVEIPSESCAKILAERNPRNRPMTRKQLATLSKTLLDDVWQFNGDTVVFNDEFNLGNAQHRLRSSADTGVGLKTLVVIGVPVEAFSTYDQHSKRKLAHILGMRNEANAEVLASAIPYVLGFERYGSLVAYRRVTTIAEQEQVLGRNPGLRNSVEEIVPLSPGRLFGSTALVAAAHYVFSKADSSLASQFFADIAGGTIERGQRWTGASVLLKKLMDNLEGKRGKLRFSHISALTTKAWNGVYRGEKVERLGFGKVEAFPHVAGWTYLEGVPIEPLQMAELSKMWLRVPTGPNFGRYTIVSLVGVRLPRKAHR